jgi:iron complex outermembrane receptor protein
MSYLFKIVKCLLLGSSMLAFSSGSVLAQSNSELDEIIVTATKREERLQDVPMSISVLGEDMLEIAGIIDSRGIADSVPGITFSQAANNLNSAFIVRGIGTALNQDNLASPVAVYLDEMPMMASKSTLKMDFSLFDAKQVEVLKGPQGTLFGAGTLAGAVRIITNKPDPSGFSYKLATDIGSTSGDMRQQYNAMVNLPISDNAAVRLVAYASEDDGWVTNVSTGQDPSNKISNIGFRAGLGWQVNDRFNANFTYILQETEVDDGSTINPALGEDSRSGYGNEATEIEVQKFNMTLTYDLGFAELTSSTNFSENDGSMDVDLSNALGNMFPLLLHREPDDEAFVQELRLVSNSDSQFDWVLGAFYLDRETDVIEAFYVTQEFADSRGGSIGNTISTLGVDNAFIYGGPVPNSYEETAIFGELGYQLTNSLKATLGFRTGDMENANSRPAGGSSVLGSFIGPVVFMGASSFNPVPYQAGTYEPGKTSNDVIKFSLAWQMNDQINLFATASEGFRSNEINRSAFVRGLDGQLGSSGLDPNDPIIIPPVSASDKLWNYEIGMKGRWDGFSANLSIYQMVWEDIQLVAQRGGGDPTSFFTNAGEAESEGVELELLANPNENFEFGLNVAYQDATVTELSEREALMVGAEVGSSLVSPDLQVSGHFMYTMALDGGNEAFGRLGYSYTDQMPNGFENQVGNPNATNPRYTMTDSYSKLDFSVGLNTDKWSVALYGENILDNDDYVFVMQQTFFNNAHMTLRPRTFGIRVSMRQ